LQPNANRGGGSRRVLSFDSQGSDGQGQ
jgi:hypothetical protein